MLLNRALTNDDTSTEIDDGAITSQKIVDNIRKLMNDTKIVNPPIQAYVIPSVDAHQVISQIAISIRELIIRGK